MDARFAWFGLLVPIIVALMGVLLWATGDRSSCADWQDEHHESVRKGKEDGDGGGDGAEMKRCGGSMGWRNRGLAEGATLVAVSCPTAAYSTLFRAR